MMVGREVLLRVEKPRSEGWQRVDSKSRTFQSLIKGGAKRVNDVSFEVRSGEILGIAGVEGNGQTELIEALAGLVDPVACISGRSTLKARSQNDGRARPRVSLASHTFLKIVIVADCCSILSR
jgi:ABC-type uncharacterized transport system ATPase subunit